MRTTAGRGDDGIPVSATDLWRHFCVRDTVRPVTATSPHRIVDELWGAKNDAMGRRIGEEEDLEVGGLKEVEGLLPGGSGVASSPVMTGGPARGIDGVHRLHR